MESRAHTDDRLTSIGPPGPSQDGLTLIEILVSILLLSLVGMAFALSLGMGQEEIVDDGHRRMALTLAEEKMEELKAFDYDDPDLAVGNYQETVTLDDQGTSGTTDDLTGTRSWTVTGMANPADPMDLDSYKQIALTLSWTTRGQTHTVELDTFIAQKGA